MIDKVKLVLVQDRIAHTIMDNGSYLLFCYFTCSICLMMTDISTLIKNIALGEVLLKFETLREVPNTKSWYKESEYKISGLIIFYSHGLQFTNVKNEIVKSIDYEEITKIKSQEGLAFKGPFSQPFGTFQSLIVRFILKNGESYEANIITEIHLTEQDLKIEKSPAPSLEKTLKTIYPGYKKIDHKQPDFPEYDI